MTNQILHYDDERIIDAGGFLPANAWASGRQAGQHFRTQLVNELKEVLQQSSQTTKQWLKSTDFIKILTKPETRIRGLCYKL